MSWVPNLALHEKIAARVKLSTSGAQQQDACDETRTNIGPNWEIDLIRDSVTVATITFNSLLTLGTEQLTATTAAAAELFTADIDTGTWTAKIRSSDGTYELDTTSVSKTSGDVVVSADIDPAIGVAVSITLAFDSDLTSGGVGSVITSGAILLLGDSTIYGHNSIDGNVVADTPRDILAGNMSPDFTVAAEGVGSTTTSNLLAGTGGFSDTLANILAGSSADVVVYTFGINDSYMISNAQFETNIASIISETVSAGKTPVFETPNPTVQNLVATVSSIKSVCAANSVAVIDQYSYINGVLNGAAVTTLMLDGYHPSQGAYVIKGEYTARRLREILGISRNYVARPFVPSGPWRSPVPGSAVYSTDARTTQIRTAVQWGVASFNYTPNVYYATASDPTQTVKVHNLFGSYSDFYVTIPWPADAVPNGFATGQQGSDHWICIVDPDGITAHEMFYAQWDGTQWTASSYCRTRLDGTGWNLFSLSGINTDNTLSAGPNNNGGASRAVSVSLLGGLIREDELVNGINHAIACAIPNGWLKGAVGSRVYPADAVDYADGGYNPIPTGPIPYSTRFALSPSLDLNSLGFDAYWLKVAEAIQTYGMYVVDVAGWSGSPSIYSEWPNNYTQGQALRNTQGTHFSKITSRLYALDWV